MYSMYVYVNSKSETSTESQRLPLDPKGRNLQLDNAKLRSPQGSVCHFFCLEQSNSTLLCGFSLVLTFFVFYSLPWFL